LKERRGKKGTEEENQRLLYQQDKLIALTTGEERCC
jgi:hypothetical protein